MTTTTDQTVHDRSTPYRPVGAGTLAVLVTGPALVLASELVAPRWPDGLTPAQDAAFVLDHADRLLVSWVVGLAAAGFLAAAFVLAATRITGRGRVAARVAAVLGVTGAVGVGAHMSTELLLRDLVLADPGSVGVLAEAENGVAMILQVLMLVLGTTLGLIALAVATVRAGAIGRWVVVVAVLALVADFSPTGWSTAIFAALMTIVMVAVARGLARQG